MRPRFLMVILLGVALLAPWLRSAQGFDKIHGSHGLQPKVNYDSLFAIAAPLEDSPDGRAMIAACLEAYGGREHLESLKSFQLDYRMQPMMSTDSIDVVKAFATGRRYRTTRDTSKGKVTRGLSGDGAWYQDPDTLVVLDSGRYRAELFSFLTLAMPLALETELFADIRFGFREGDSLAYVYCETADSLMIVVGIHPQDHRIWSSEGIVRQDEKTIVYVNHFSDFRQWDGYWFPHHLINISMGMEVGQSVLGNIQVNVAPKQLGLLPPAASGLERLH